MSFSANSEVTFSNHFFLKIYLINTIICANAQNVTKITENYGCINRPDCNDPVRRPQNMNHDIIQIDQNQRESLWPLMLRMVKPFNGASLRK